MPLVSPRDTGTFYSWFGFSVGRTPSASRHSSFSCSPRRTISPAVRIGASGCAAQLFRREGSHKPSPRNHSREFRSTASGNARGPFPAEESVRSRPPLIATPVQADPYEMEILTSPFSEGAFPILDVVQVGLPCLQGQTSPLPDPPSLGPHLYLTSDCTLL